MIRIEFCGVCTGFRQEAETLAEYLKAQGEEVKLIEAGRGRFHVYVDDKLVFSIKKCRRYPNAREIMKLISNNKQRSLKQSVFFKKDL